MKTYLKKHIFCISVFLVVGLFITCSVSVAQEKSDEELKKKFAQILGEYAFDMEGQTFTLNFYVEGGELWADSGDGRPATMKAIEDEVFAFTAEDPMSGLFEFKFLKDDQGKYTICHVINEDMGLETKGIKKK